MDRGSRDRVSNPPPIETTLADVEAVLDAVGSPKTTLVGLWDGCLTSALYAATHPDRVASLVLFGSSAVQTASADYPWAWDRAPGTSGSRASAGAGARARGSSSNARWMGPGMLDDPAELEHWIAYTRLAASPSSAEAVMRIHMDTDIRDVLPVVHAPTLVLHRTGDRVEPIDGGRYVAARIPDARFVELAGDDGIPWIGDAGAVLREIEAFVTGDAAPRTRTDRRLATVLFTDIVASTEHVVAVGDSEWQQVLTTHDEVVRRELARCNGRLIDSAGDGMLATFEGPAAAIRCARAIMHGVEATRPRTAGRGAHGGGRSGR